MLPADDHQGVVSIPIDILVEALDELGLHPNAATEAHATAPLGGVLRVNDMIVVRGLANSALTNQIVPGPGEAVVELPLDHLISASRELAVIR